MSTPKAIKTSSEACRRTVQRRTSLLKKQIDISSKDRTKQSAALVKSYSKNERAAILTEGNLGPHKISAEDMVALKIRLGIPWEKLKTMAR